MAPTESPSRPPNERYEILGRIAIGGMAEIYLAKDLAHHREVILKRLMPGLQSDAEFVRMFYDEANIAARLRHPNIVTIHELGELDGSFFIAMELLKGVNLRELQMQLNQAGRAIPLGLGISIAMGALSALDYAHRFTDQYDRSLRVVHRDVSPQNVIITFDGGTKLVDFGVAKAEGRLHQTRAGLIKGKFAYMSPEQISGGQLDGRSDIFALGEVLYELFLRRHPFYAQAEMDMLRAVLDDPPPHPNTVDPQFPKPLSNIILRALCKMPEDRYGTAGLMRKDLEQFASSANISLNQGLLARFVQDLFRDRLAKLDGARATGDIDGLVKAMRVHDGAPSPRLPVSPPMVAPDQPSRYDESPSQAQVVEVASGSADPAEQGRFVAQGDVGGAGNPQRYEKSDVFDAPKLDTPTVRHTPASLEAEGDLPTVMGHLSADEMAQLREAAAQVRAGSPPSKPVPLPAEGATKPVVQAQGEQAAAERAKMPSSDRGALPRPVRPSTPESLADLDEATVASDPAELGINVDDLALPERDRPRPVMHAEARPAIMGATTKAMGGAAITPRSETVVPEDEDVPSNQNGGMVLFVAGVVALVAAVAYAVYLLSRTSS